MDSIRGEIQPSTGGIGGDACAISTVGPAASPQLGIGVTKRYLGSRSKTRIPMPPDFRL
jgi:hypothetical protein